MNLDDFFRRATEGLDPFPYQRTLANGNRLPWLLDVPTGSGKTAAVVLGWLWRRRHSSGEVGKATPRRLVYCLPMRVLVEQTVRNVQQWLVNLGLLAKRPGEQDKVGVYQLMGGEVEMGWDTWPEAEAILVGTQDQLLSRALNRGYAMSRYRWPVHFGLLNNDCLWIMDEVQLMGPGLPTTSQLQAFRELLTGYGSTGSLWMSATLRRDDLVTVDAPAGEEFDRRALSLSSDDIEHPRLSRQISAAKSLEKLDLTLSSSTRRTYARKLAERVWEAHQTASLTLVVLNQVRRAQELVLQLHDQRQTDDTELCLLHSRLRPAERRVLEETLSSEVPAAGRIIVATQAIEAGVDISARTLFTEIAPWSSLVQRFGRCNRRGEWQGGENARVYWVNLEADFPPYEETTLEVSRELLSGLDDVGIEILREVQDSTPSRPTQVLRKRDLIELFDTTPDLAGHDIDVSPYIRDVEDLDVVVLWRDPEERQAAPVPEELCTVGLAQFREFMLDLRDRGISPPQIWDGLEDQWVPVRRDILRPGMTVLLDVAAGGYNTELGWWPEAEQRVPSVERGAFAEIEVEGYDDDHLSSARRLVSLSEHTADVAEEVDRLLEELSIDDESAEVLRRAAVWHDVGKAHPYFQQLVLAGLAQDDPLRDDGPWAKSARFGRPEQVQRPHFRHEVASALAMMQHDSADLAAYLVASHHGKVRMSIRSLPDERRPDDGGRFARGIWEGDVLPRTTLIDGTQVPETVLSLEVMELGMSEAGPSWLERTLKLRDEYGPFRLAFLEAVLRIADWRASAKERELDV